MNTRPRCCKQERTEGEGAAAEGAGEGAGRQRQQPRLLRRHQLWVPWLLVPAQTYWRRRMRRQQLLHLPGLACHFSTGALAWPNIGMTKDDHAYMYKLMDMVL